MDAVSQNVFLPRVQSYENFSKLELFRLPFYIFLHMLASRRKLVEIVNLTSVARSASPLHNRRSMEHIPWHITVNALRITFERGIRTLKNLARNVENPCNDSVKITQ